MTVVSTATRPYWYAGQVRAAVAAVGFAELTGDGRHLDRIAALLADDALTLSQLDCADGARVLHVAPAGSHGWGRY